MREILITILILGCISTYTSAVHGLFEFHDSYGRCWRCFPGSACVRCSTVVAPFVTGPPIVWDRTCGQPSPETCATYLGAKFPHTDIGFYWICADDPNNPAGSIVVEAPCFCDHVFDMLQQRCVFTHELTTIACDAYTNQDPQDCATIGDITTTTTTTTTTTRAPDFPIVPTVPNESTTRPPIWIPTAPNEPPTTPPTIITTTPPIWVPTAPNDPNNPTTTRATTTTTIWVPTPPNESTTTPPIWVPTPPNDSTTTPPIWVPTAPGDSTTTTADKTTSDVITDPITTTPRTTEIGGPDGWPPVNTPTIPSDTTPAPCVCVVWWPCWCNPCWNMPCHSCNGCVGMMG